jgi:hypothetical protein
MLLPNDVLVVLSCGLHVEQSLFHSSSPNSVSLEPLIIFFNYAISKSMPLPLPDVHCGVTIRLAPDTTKLYKAQEVLLAAKAWDLLLASDTVPSQFLRSRF